jgi:GNAT superfamily N-acetyltransferase
VITDADTVAAAVGTTLQHLVSAVPDGWVLRDGGAVALVTGVRVPTLNGVWPERADPDPGSVAGLLDRVGAAGVPYCLQLRPGSSPVLAELAAARGMSPGGEIPLMVMEDPAALAQARPPAGLAVRELAPERARLHASVAAAGFEFPEELVARFITADVLRLPGVRCYIGEIDGQPVATGLGVTLGAFVGVFNIATLPTYRRRGYGAAITARVVADGLAAGAKWSWLQSTPDGHAIYARLAFRTIESWQSWITEA